MSLVTTLLITSIAVSGQIADITPPPLPDFEHPVDYVKWYTDQMRFAQSDNALDLYEPFLYGNNKTLTIKLTPPPNSKVFEQLQELFSKPEPWYPTEHQELAKWVAQTGAKFHKPFVEAIDKKYYANKSNPRLDLLCQANSPNLANGRAVGQMLFAWAWRVMNNTIETSNLRAAICANLAFANHISCEPGMNEQFFALGHRSFVYDQILATLPSRIHYKEFWIKTLEYVEKLDAVPINHYYARSLYFSEASALQLLQHFCMSKEPGKENSITKTINMKQVDAFFRPQKQEKVLFMPEGVKDLKAADPVILAKAIHAYYNSMRNILNAPNATDLQKKLKVVEEEAFKKHPALNALLTPISMPLTSALRTEAKRRTMHVFLNMAIHFRETGQWPQSLGEIKKKAINKYKTDPFTGKELLTKPLGRRCLVYSVGPDGVDNGGNAYTDIVSWALVSPEPKPIKLKASPKSPEKNPAKTVTDKKPEEKQSPANKKDEPQKKENTPPPAEKKTTGKSEK